ncbi:MAG TPA: AI-2E family transporter [Thermoanaerobaculia bacterium]|jgi:predicted PurR-regulated permease PerM|nr:AI-2E family transporter [Thermoanaerobaculia bacterium]
MRTPRNVTIQKWAIWIGFLGMLVLLRHLFPVIFLTFVLTYIANTLVNGMTRRWQRRRLNLAAVFVLFLAILGGVGALVVPKMFAEARQLAVFSIARGQTQPQPANQETMLDRETRRYVDTILIAVVGRDTFRSFAGSTAYAGLLERVEKSIRGFLPKVTAGVGEFVNSSIAIFVQFLLSIVLSFLILWDLPSLQRGVTALATGRTSEVYSEIAPGITAFGVMLGRAFEAQTLIAVVNAVLTSIGFLILGIPSIALLATIVFFCSYIPVVGVMLSTLPAALFAFKTGGVALVLWLVVMVLVVHAVEAYMLNPIIYGRHMKMHPVAILVILMVGEHLFGIWGLLLGVPVAAFLWTYGIQGKDVRAAG